MDFVSLWKEKLVEGLIRFDPEPQLIANGGKDGWGKVYYSESRERYKAQVRGKTSTSFDPVLMERLHLGNHGSLSIAANPNSMFEGHLVIYPTREAPALALSDFDSINKLASENPDYSFIHNAVGSAASVTNWAHFQAYVGQFPLTTVPTIPLVKTAGINASTLSAEFPAYAVRVDWTDPSRTASFLHRISRLLDGAANPHGTRIPVNFVWIGNSVWIFPRAHGQSERAATYFGGLEMGGIFCSPTYEEVAFYTPPLLRSQVVEATFRSELESESRSWFEARVAEILKSQ